MGFDINAYGQEVCGIMARSWCHKMQFYFDLEHADPAGQSKIFRERDHDGYTEPSEFTKLVSAGQYPTTLAKRIAQVRSMFH